MFARTRGFDGCVEGKKVGLAGNLADYLDDLADFLGGRVDEVHRFDRAFDCLGALVCLVLGFLRDAVGHGAVLGNRVDGGAEFFDRSADFLGGTPQRLCPGRDSLCLVGNCLGVTRKLGRDPRHFLFQFDLCGDVAGKFDYFDDFAFFIEDRAVRGANPDFLALLVKAQELAGVVFACAQVFPKLLVLGPVHVAPVAEHAVVPALDLAQVVARGFAEVFVCGNNRAVGFKFDDRLHETDRVELAVEGQLFAFRLRDVRLDRHKAFDFAVLAENRVDGERDPVRRSILGIVDDFVHEGFLLFKLFPNALACFGVRQLALQNRPGRLADTLFGLVAGEFDKARVHIFDAPSGICDNHRVVGFVRDKRQALGGFAQFHLFSDIGGKLYNLEDGAIAIDNRVVDRLDPDFGSVLFEPLEFAFVFLALGQFPPELLVVVGCDIVGIAEDLVMASLDFVQRVAKGIQKVFVCRGDCAIGPELDDSLGPIEAFENAGIHAGIGHVVPFQHVADVIAVFVEDAADIQGEFVIANGNVGFPGQVGGI